jgi:hypothetical protein
MPSHTNTHISGNGDSSSVTTTQPSDDHTAFTFVSRLGATMTAANYPVTVVEDTIVATSRVYGLDSGGVGGPSDSGRAVHHLGR